jgi:hypothetical protein
LDIRGVLCLLFIGHCFDLGQDLAPPKETL